MMKLFFDYYVFLGTVKRQITTFPKTTQRPVTLTGVDPFSHYVIWISAFTRVGEGPTNRCPSSGNTSEGSE